MKINALVGSSENKQNSINFGYSSILKDLFRGGEMPSVTKGIYGNPINSSNVSLEHLKPKSKGGASNLSNYALADKAANQARGNQPLSSFLTKDMLDGYLEQFNFEIPEKFNGYQYQEMIRQTCAEQGVSGTLKAGIKEVVSTNGDSFVKQLPTKVEVPVIDYGSMKSIIENIDFVDLGRLSKKMLKSLKNRGFIK